MSDFESKIDINIDAGQALAAIKTLQRQISDFHTSLAKGSATANIKSLQMQQSLIDTINATGQYSASMKTVASSTQTFTTALEKNKLSMGQYFKYAGGASKSFGKFFRTEMDTIQKVAIERVKDLQTQYVKMGRDANGAIKTIAIRPLALDMENLSTKTQIAAQKQQLLNQLLKQGSTNLLNFGKNTQWAGRQLMVGFTIPLGILGTTAARTFMNMEKQAIAFKRVYGDTFTASKETDAMLKQVQQLASEFTKYGVAVEKTMEQAAKAAATGKMGADLLAQVSEATRLSVLGNVEQAQALETTISLTNAFGTAADELRGKINFLNAVENQTVTSIEDLTIAIPKAAPVIKQLGGNVEDLTFFLTAMREGGINASESANALKSGLASLINPTKKASDFLQSFGININKIVEGNKGDVQGLVVDFAKALDTLDPLNRARAIEQLFGKFQFSRLSTLFQNVIKDGSQAARVLELTRQSSAELGILAQRELNRIASSPMYKFEKAVADFKKELAPVGEEFLKAVTPIINFATDVLKAFNNLDGGVKQFIVNSTGLIAGIGPVFLMTFGLLANGVANIIKGFTFVKNVFNKAASASTVLGETTDYMTQQQLEAASVAASLEQVHNKLTQAFTVEATAVGKLASAYQKAIAAQVAFTGPAPAGKGRAPKKYAAGVFSVPGPKGAGDIVPAMLSPGEAVIPAGPAQKYRGFIKGMISGKIPGFNDGTEEVKPKNPKKVVTLGAAISKMSSDQPTHLTNQTAALMHADFPNEQEIVRQAFAAQGFDIVGNDDDRKSYGGLMQPHAAHIGGEGSRRAVAINTKGGWFARWIKNWAAKFITPQIGVMNKYMQDISDPDMETKAADPKQKGKKVALYRDFLREDNIKRVAKALKIPVAEVIKHAKHLFAGNEALTPQETAVLGKIAETHRDSIRVTDRMGKSARRKANAEIARTSSIVSLAARRVSMANDPGGYFLGRGKYKDDKKKNETFDRTQERKLEAATKRATVAEIKARNDQEALAAAQSKEAVTETKGAKRRTRKAATNAKPKTKPKTKPKEPQSKVTPVPKVTTSEDLGEGLRRVVSTDANGKQKETYYQQGRRGALSATAAQAMLAARSGATASPGGRVKRFLTGATGKVAGGSMIGSMIARSVGGEGGDGLANILDIVSTAAFAKGMFPEKPLGPDGKKVPSRIGTAIRGSTIAKKITPYLDDLARALKVAAPGILRVLGPVGLVVTGGTIAFDILTEKARKQSEIAGALLDTVLVTKDKLEAVNNFFGTEAKLSSIREAGPVGIGETQGGASLAEQFRTSEEFQKTYKPFVEKIIEGSGSDITLALNSLAVELMASGLDKEVVQIIIDAIKQEAKRTDLVIDVNSLSLDTKGGLEQLRKGIASAISDYKSKVSEFDPFGFNANSLKLSLQEVTNFLNGLGTAYQSTAVSSKDFNRQYDLFIQKVNTLSSKEDKLKFLNDSLKLLSPEIAALTQGLYNLDSAALLVKLTLAGIGISKEAANILRVNDPKDVKAFYEAADKAFKAKDKQLASLTAKQKQLTDAQEQLEKKESDINDKYDERITALERINDLQKQIAEKQKSQLDLADALSRGDVFAAAKAVQDIRAKDAQYAIEQQKQALEDARAKETGAVQDKIGGIQKQIQNIDSQILQIQNANITIDTYLSKEDYEAGYELPPIKPELRPGIPKGQGIRVFKDDKGKQYTTVEQLNQFLNAGWKSTTRVGTTFPDKDGKTWKVTQAVDTDGNNEPNFVYVTPAEVKKAAGGYISGPGSGTSDSIPARLSDGEYVIRAKAVQALGTNVLDKMNYADKFAKGGIVNKPKTGSTASIYSDDKSVDMSDGNVIGHGLNFVMNSIYEMLFGKWAVKTKQGTPTAPDLEDMGTMAMNIVPIPGMKGFKSAQLAAKGFMQTGTVAGAKAAQSGAKLKALDSFSLSSPLTRQGVEIGEMAKYTPTQSDYYLKAYKSDTAVQMPYKGINEPLAYWLSQRLGSDVVPYEFLKFGKGAGETIGPFGMVKDSATLVASKINKNLITGMLGNNALMNSPQMEKIFLNAYKQGGPEALKKAIQEYLASIQKYADNTSLLNTLFSNADIHGKNVMYDTASKAITQLDFGHAGLFTDLLSGSYSKLPTKFSYLNDFYTKNPLESLSPGDLGYDVIKLEQGLQSFLLDASRTIPELPEIMSSINAGKTIMNPDNFLKGLSNLYKSGDPLEAFVKDASMGDRGLEKWLTSMLLKDVQGISGKTNISKSFADVVDDMIKFVPSLLKKLPKVENWFNVPGMTPKKPLGKSGVVDIQAPNVGNEFKPWHTGPQAKNGGLVKFAKGGLVKRDVTSSDPGLDWFNSFIQNLLGGGNPSAAMQNDATKSLLAQSYTQGAKNMGVDPTDPMFYASMFAPSMGIKALGMAGKGVSKLKGLSASKNTGPRVTLANYIDTPRVSQAYLNFMRTNPAISVRMRSEQLIDKLAKKDFAYRNAFEEGMVVDDLDPRLEVENMLFGLGKDAPASSRPIYGAGVSPYTPWSIRGKASRNDNAFERWALRSKSSNINSEYFDRYGDISLLLKNRVKKRSTFTLGDSFVARKTDSLVPGGTKKTVAAPFGTMSQSKILGASTAMNRPELQFVEAQIFGGLPFSDIKKIIVKNPEMIPLLQQKLAEAGLKIPVGQTKLSPLGKLNEMFYKNKVHGPTGLPMFIPQYKSGGMFRTPYANGGLAMLHDKEFVMNPGAVKEYGVDKLKAMNNGTYNGGSVYNSYGVNISVDGSNTSANDIARTVIKEIKRLDSQNLRSTAV
jgi:hypothetical protein